MPSMSPSGAAAADSRPVARRDRAAARHATVGACGSWLGCGALLLVATPVARAEQPPSPSPTVAVEPNGQRPVAGSPEEPSQGPTTDCVGDRFVVLRETGFEPALAAEVRTDFATELAHRGLGVCSTASSPREPAAVVELKGRDSLVIISLDDRITHKRVARDLSLQAIPANGRALAIAIAIDELLRASWAELTLRRPGGQDEEEEGEEDGYSVVETQPVNAREFARGRTRRASLRTRYHLGADFGYLHTARNFDAFALNARGSVRPWGWGWFDLSLGGLATVPVHSANGDIRSAGMRSALTAGACARPRARVSGCAGPRVELDVLMLHGVHPKSAEARRANAAVVSGSLVALLAVMLREQTYMFGELALGAVLHGAEATNGTATLMGVTGMLLSLNVGLGYEL